MSAGRRILLATPAQALGGAEAYLEGLAAHLRRLGHSVTVAVDSGAALDPLARRLAASGCEVRRGPIAWRWTAEPALVRLRDQMAGFRTILDEAVRDGERPDVVFVNLNWANAGTALLVAATLTGVGAVALCHLCPQTILLDAAEVRLLRWCLDQKQSWFAVSRDSCFFFARSIGVTPDRIGVIHNGPLSRPDGLPEGSALDDARAAWRRDAGLPATARVALGVGRLHTQKGLLDILPVLSHLFSRDAGLHVLWIGDGPLRAPVERLVASTDLSGRLRLAGPRDDVGHCLGLSDLFLFPSRYEGFSLALVEALNAGCPPVAFDIGGVREILEPEVNGLVVPPGRIWPFAAAVLRLLGDDALRRRLAGAGRQTAARFTAEAMLSGATGAILAARPPSVPSVLSSDALDTALVRLAEGLPPRA
ncbi:glycosyltransferase involved in cell wall biosynthesis [Azospirillum brasilense]|nr:glycosyltransferase involved in cell wall biosynthesis [Azospirillum brasilense]